MSLRGGGRSSHEESDRDAEKLYSVSVHPTLPIAAIGTSASAVKVYNLRTGMFQPLLPQMGAVHALQFSPCGYYLATCASSAEQESYRIAIWRVSRDGEMELLTDDQSIPDTAVLKGASKLHQGDIRCVAFRPTSDDSSRCSVLASGSADQSLRLWHFRLGESDEDINDEDDFTMTREIVREHNGAVRALAFSDRGRVLATAAEDGTVYIWKFRAGRAVEVHQWVRFGTGGEIPVSLSFFPTHSIVQNMYGVPMREWRLAVATAAGVLVLEVRNTYVPFGVAAADVHEHLRYGGEVGDDPAEDYDDVAAVDRGRSFRTLRASAERGPAGADDDMNYLEAHVMQEESLRGGVTSVVVAQHDAGGGRGCHALLMGTARGDVVFATIKATRAESIKPFVITPVRLARHGGPVLGVAHPSADVLANFVESGVLDYDDHIAVTASLDETARVHTFAVRASSGAFSSPGFEVVPGAAPAVILERPLTAHRSAEVYDLREQVRKADLEMQQAEAAAVARVKARGSTEQQRERAVGALEAFNATALVQGGVIPRGRLAPGGGGAPAVMDPPEAPGQGQGQGQGPAPGGGGADGRQPQLSAAAAERGVRKQREKLYELKAGRSRLVNFQQLAARQHKAETGGSGPAAARGACSTGDDGACVVM